MGHRRKLAWICLTILVVGAGLAAWASSASTGGSPGLAGRPASLDTRLLTPTDLPSGWQIDTSGNGEADNCSTDPLLKMPSAGSASVTFSRVQNTAIELFETVVYSSTAETTYAEVRKNLADCKTFTDVGPGTLTPLVWPVYGDESVAYLQTINVAQLSIQLQLGFVVVRDGNYLCYLALFPSGPFDPAQLQALIPRALAKIDHPGAAPVAPPTTRITGTVTLETANGPVPLRADINVSTAGGATSALADSLGGANGSFTFDVPPGSYNISATAAGIAPCQTTAHVNAGQTITVQLVCHEQPTT